MHSADMNERRQPARSAIVDGFLPLWAFFPLKVLQVPAVRTCSLRNWNPRPACGTAFSSVHPILSVCVLRRVIQDRRRNMKMDTVGDT